MIFNKKSYFFQPSWCFIILISMGIYIDTWPLYQKYKDTTEKYSHALSTIKHASYLKKSTLTSRMPPSVLQNNPANKLILLKMMSKIAHESNVEMVAVKATANKKKVLNTQQALYMLSGTAKQLLIFMDKLTRENPTISLGDYAIKMTKERVMLLEADVKMQRAGAYAESSALTVNYNPFCNAEKFDRQLVPSQTLTSQTLASQALASSVPLQLKRSAAQLPSKQGNTWVLQGMDVFVEKLELAGVLRKQDRMIAWIKAPDGSIFPVSEGDKIGLQQVVIQSIVDGRVRMARPGQPDVVISNEKLSLIKPSAYKPRWTSKLIHFPHKGLQVEYD